MVIKYLFLKASELHPIVFTSSQRQRSHPVQRHFSVTPMPLMVVRVHRPSCNTHVANGGPTAFLNVSCVPVQHRVVQVPISRNSLTLYGQDGINTASHVGSINLGFRVVSLPSCDIKGLFLGTPGPSLLPTPTPTNQLTCGRRSVIIGCTRL